MSKVDKNKDKGATTGNTFSLQNIKEIKEILISHGNLIVDLKIDAGITKSSLKNVMADNMVLHTKMDTTLRDVHIKMDNSMKTIDNKFSDLKQWMRDDSEHKEELIRIKEEYIKAQKSEEIRRSDKKEYWYRWAIGLIAAGMLLAIRVMIGM